MNSFFTIKGRSFFYNCKEKAENKYIKKPFKNSDFLKSNFIEHFLHNKG